MDRWSRRKPSHIRFCSCWGMADQRSAACQGRPWYLEDVGTRVRSTRHNTSFQFSGAHQTTSRTPSSAKINGKAMSKWYEYVSVLAIVVCMVALTYVVATAYPNLTRSLAYQPDTLSDKRSPPVKPMANPPRRCQNHRTPTSKAC